MDETCIYLDNPSNYTFACRGSKRVKANTCGSERTRTYLKDFIPPENVVVHYKSHSTFNDDVICAYMQKV
ncbi:hypothetical protein BpHYR1_019039 [Brachionus plicatilis]|uniref:Uncharacterized protein n=1 Tax=Brachionus plicatilis TaxID=10195 RepID=A0A3M7PMY5_BRAPC|nr:hypothetical protein BpHYR1_019039 [Brachionus plicatilis]